MIESIASNLVPCVSVFVVHFKVSMSRSLVGLNFCLRYYEMITMRNLVTLIFTALCKKNILSKNYPVLGSTCRYMKLCEEGLCG